MNPVLARLRDAAQQQSDPAFWEYVMRGSGGHVSARDSESSWQQYRFRPHVLRNVSSVETGIELFGHFRTPIGVAPTAFHSLGHSDGECATAAGARAGGSPLVVSSRATRRIEDIAAAVDGPWWFQVYVTKERRVTEGMVQRAVDAGATALVLTGDTPYVGHRDIIGSGRPIELSDDLALVNMGQHLDEAQRADPWTYVDQDPGTDLAVVDWLTGICDVPVIVKGVLRDDDAFDCVRAGAAGIWVSNHGGRQLDRSISPAEALPEIVAAVGSSTPVMVDGGVRDGFDALTALALGASAVFVGRPALWGLIANGAAGVEQVLRELTAELGHAMGLAGVATVAQTHGNDLVTRRP